MRVLTHTDDMRVFQNAVELLKGFDKSTLSAFVIVYASSLSSQKMVIDLVQATLVWMLSMCSLDVSACILPLCTTGPRVTRGHPIRH